MTKRKVTDKGKFWTFHQNNSGGKFHYDANDGISVNVIVQADDKEDAIYRAQRIGIYFNGVADNRDCECCGDRWSDYCSDDGTDLPQVYGITINPLLCMDDNYGNKDYRGTKWMDDYEGFIHYKDGTIRGFWKE